MILNKLFTIGFTQKKAEEFFNLLRENKVETVIDIRLNNTSQLAAFAKYPDIEFFLREIGGIGYIHDKTFSPEESTLSKYKKKMINWEEYECEFSLTMAKRKIERHIIETYFTLNNICLLCSEAEADQCHRRLVANIFKSQFSGLEITNL